MILIMQLLALVPFLVVASYLDLKTRKVTNEIWFYMFGIEFIFIVYNVYTYGFLTLAVYLAGYMVLFSFAFFLYTLGGIGGADCKAFITIGLLNPALAFSALGYAVPLALISAPKWSKSIPFMVHLTLGFIFTYLIGHSFKVYLSLVT